MQDLEGKIKAMARGDKINFTENRAVLHMVRHHCSTSVWMGRQEWSV